jgi:hypothetical protein
VVSEQKGILRKEHECAALPLTVLFSGFTR